MFNRKQLRFGINENIKLKSSKGIALFSIMSIMAGIFVIVIYYFLFAELPKHNVVWELGDESGYLFNAALFSGFNWNSIASQAYYGFGYSVFLIPGFFVCKTGADLIIFSHVVNMIFDILSFIIMYILVAKLLSESLKRWFILISIVPVFSPHIVAQSLEVTCESCLFFFTILSFYELYSLFLSNRFRYYIGTAISTSYLFFIHTRAIGVVVGIWLTIIIWNRGIIKQNLRSLIISVIIFTITFTLLYCLKNYIVNYKNYFHATKYIDSEGINNIVNSSFIIERLSWFIKEPVIGYVAVFFIKILYSMYSSAALLIIVFFETVSSVKKKEIGPFELTSISLLLSWFITISLCTASGLGESATYSFYGRYYEHVVLAITFWGLVNIFTKDYALLSHKTFMIVTYIVLCFTKIASFWLKQRGFLKISEVDNNRIASLGYLVGNITNSSESITVLIALITLFIALFLNYKSFQYKYFAIVIILFFYLLNSDAAINKLNIVTENSQGDVLLADFVVQNDTDMKIAFLDDDTFKYKGFYARMQVLLKDYEIEVIESEDINDYLENCTDDYFLIYKSSPIKNNLSERMKVAYEGKTFECVEVSH